MGARISGERRLLAVSSSGGHWSQLMLLREAFGGHEVAYACTIVGAGRPHGIADMALLPDCNRHSLASLPALALAALRLVSRIRPDVVVSTGALPGLACIVLGRLMGARTVWVESMANSEQLSRCGAWASWIAHDCLVQWPALEWPGRTRYAGSVL